MIPPQATGETGECVIKCLVALLFDDFRKVRFA